MIDKKKQMLEVFQYILKNKYKTLTLEETAWDLGYRARTLGDNFTEYFEMPFARFVRKLRLRQAAQDIYSSQSLKYVSERNGFNQKNFFRAFKNEFGMTPKQFLESKTLVPDMPCKSEICGHEMTLEYQNVDTVIIDGYPIRPVHGNQTDLLGDVAYAFCHPSCHVNLNLPEEQWGVWWHDAERDGTLYYLMGPRAEQYQEKHEGRVQLQIRGGNYAVFSVEKGQDYFDIAHTSRELAWYVFNIWRVLNRKTMDRMGFTYEKFDGEKAYLYIPLLKGMDGIELERDSEHSIEKIVQYVDEHILENISVEDVISQFGYSDFYCRDRFQSCYKISLPDYIKRKKLYVLAQKWSDGEIKEEDFVLKYNFRSFRQFKRDFVREFKTEPQNYHDVAMNLFSLKEYYEDHMREISISVVELDEFQMIGKIIKSGDNKTEVDLDVPGIAGFWMENDFPSLDGTAYDTKKGEITEKVSLYESVKESARQKQICNYILGPIRKGGEEVPEDMHIFTVEGGKYAVFESVQNESGEEDLTETIRMMIRCVDHVWIHDNWVRTDFRSRISFLYYKNKKIYYYVPICG